MTLFSGSIVDADDVLRRDLADFEEPINASCAASQGEAVFDPKADKMMLDRHEASHLE